MKKILAVSIVILLLPTLFLSVKAERPDLFEIYDELPKDVQNKLPDNFDKEIKEDDGIAAVQKLNGSFILSLISKTLALSLSELAPILMSLIGTVFLSALLCTFSHESGEGIGRALEFSSSVAVFLLCLGAVKPLWDQVSDALNAISLIIKAALPVLTAIGGASGQPSSSLIHAAWLTALLTLTEELTRNILSPLISVCIAFISVSAFARSGGASDISGVVNGIKKVFLFLMALFTGAFTVIMSFQSVIAKGSDTVLIRSVKFASGNMIPVVGGALSEAAGVYISSISAIKGAAGTLTAVSLILSVLPIFLKLFSMKIGFLFSAFISEIIGSKSSAVIKEFASLIDFMLALLAICSVIFIIAIGVFASSLPGV